MEELAGEEEVRVVADDGAVGLVPVPATRSGDLGVGGAGPEVSRRDVPQAVTAVDDDLARRATVGCRW